MLKSSRESIGSIDTNSNVEKNILSPPTTAAGGNTGMGLNSGLVDSQKSIKIGNFS